jgi:hypothetical protein
MRGRCPRLLPGTVMAMVTHAMYPVLLDHLGMLHHKHSCSKHPCQLETQFWTVDLSMHVTKFWPPAHRICQGQVSRPLGPDSKGHTPRPQQHFRHHLHAPCSVGPPHGQAPQAVAAILQSKYSW